MENHLSLRHILLHSQIRKSNYGNRKNGKGLKKINRKGQGSEEYAFINGIVLDEDNKVMTKTI
ncbi:6-bladed beta-propeller [Bacteroides helcogenes]|uniref:6-bladed beta-propeller n=1 Tax=Bacteroides helcogenes TaxID=290053 RepID=UPI0002F23870|nr:6-bladed beta-propeller [Bacteroides helcogenes]